MSDLDRRMVLAGGIASSALVSSKGAYAFQTEKPSEILFRNVRVFNGTSRNLSGPTDVLVRGNKIAAIGNGLSSTGKVIEGQGRTVIPGLIDAHAHLEFYNLPAAEFATDDPRYLQLRQGAAARGYLMAGFTSTRDAGGPTFGLKRAIDEGLVEGPRIWPSGAIISQTGGHGDPRALNQLPSQLYRELTPQELAGYVAVVDGVPQVLAKVREQLFQGASQIKLAIGGGVSSNFDPLDVTQFSLEEIRAAVGAAQDWGTYVMVHGYTTRAVNRAIDCGVKSVEHGQLLDEDTLKRMAKEDIWLSLQPFLQDEDAIPTAPGSANEQKYKQVTEGTDRAYTLAKRLNVKVAFGTDIQVNVNGAARLPHYLPKLLRWYTAAEALKMATHDNANLLGLSGPRNPYPGLLGVIEPGALADILLVNGDPLADLNLLADPENNFAIIMKDGVIYKEAL